MQAASADFLILEVAPHRAGFRQVLRVIRQPRRIGREAAFEIDGDRHLDTGDDPPHAVEEQVERDLLAVSEAVRPGERMAAVAKAGAPAAATAFALPTSQMLYSSSGWPGLCTAAKRSRRSSFISSPPG